MNIGFPLTLPKISGTATCHITKYSCLTLGRFGSRNSCVSIESSTGGGSWFTAAKTCESDGGRLLWLYDMNVTEFMTHDSVVFGNKCKKCTFMWIGLIQSTFQDNNFFWKRTTNGKCVHLLV